MKLFAVIALTCSLLGCHSGEPRHHDSASSVIKWIESKGGQISWTADKYGEYIFNYSISFRGTDITDQELNRLNDLAKPIHILDFDGTAVTGVGISKIKLEIATISLRGTEVSDEIISSHLPLEHLSALYLANTKITDTTIGMILSKATELVDLDLSSTLVSPEGIHRLALHERLRHLTLREIKLGDGDLDMLTEVATKDMHLWWIDLTDTGLSAEQIQELRYHYWGHGVTIRLGDQELECIPNPSEQDAAGQSATAE